MFSTLIDTYHYLHEPVYDISAKSNHLIPRPHAIDQVNTNVSSIPWAMKGMVGVLSDCVPLFGYHKRYYIVFASLIGTVATLGLAMFPIDGGLALCVYLTKLW